MSEIDELRATVDMLAARVGALADQVGIMQLVPQYGPAVDSGSGEAAAALWTETAPSTPSPACGCAAMSPSTRAFARHRAT
jgi:hypothetical protein